MGNQLQACGRICGSEKPATSTKHVAAREAKQIAVQFDDGNADEGSSVPSNLQKWATTARPGGTPIQDEHFICMGSKAPLCPPPPPKVSSGPITLSVLQGSWVGSGGAQIIVVGTEVFLNGLPLKAHRVELRDDGTVVSIGRLWQLDGWTADGGIEFRASSTRENMECARSEVWTRKEASTAQWSEKMKLLGYAGSSENPLARGIEGCMPGTSGIEKPESYNTKKDAEDIALFTALIVQWREPALCKVCSYQVVPDFVNRAQTGLGVELVHYIASSIKEKGFQKREGNKGHDIPVVVRESPGSAFQEEALKVWKERVAEEEGFPTCRANPSDEIFTSLGNGHFFQALNLYGTEGVTINGNGRYTVGQDAALAEALSNGVPSIVLKSDTPRPVRAKIADMLNSKRDFFWTLSSDGSVDVSKMEESTAYCSQFEWLSKGMDAAQVDCLVRTHLGIRDSKRITG